MTISEFSGEFDVLYNNITSNQAPGLNEYEKSVFLTKAQSQLINEYFNIRTDGVGGGFDGSQRRQYDFSSLIKVVNPSYVLWATPTIDRRSLVYAFPKDFYLAVNEMLSDGSYLYSVSALSYQEYLRLMLKPYSFPVKKGAWRLLSGKEICNIYSDDGYYFASSYTGLKISLTVKLAYLGSITPTTPDSWGTTISYTAKSGTKISITPTVSSSGDTKTIVLDCKVNTAIANVSDNLAVKLILEAFLQLLYAKNHNLISTGNSIQAGTALNWLQTFIAPESKYNFLTLNSTTLVGKTILTSIVKGIPFVEIIGKFKTTPPEYQLRYILRPKPIILEELADYGTDLTIEGESGVSECILPEETHQEILERAVTLAKIAWLGGTSTLAQLSRRNDDD